MAVVHPAQEFDVFAERGRITRRRPDQFACDPSQQGQQAFVQTVGDNSRRTDVPKGNPDVYPPDGADKRFLNLYRQDLFEEVDKTRDMTRDWLK